MDKQPDNIPKNEITAKNILNYLQTNNITNEIFLEILSEIKEKQGYKCLKKMVLDLISKHEGVLYNPRTERSVRASIFNELCTVAFTIDTIFPNVIRSKIRNEIPNLVNSILTELKEEKEITIFISSNETVYEKANNVVPATSPNAAPVTIDSGQSSKANSKGKTNSSTRKESSSKKKPAIKTSAITKDQKQPTNLHNTEENAISGMPTVPESSSVDRLSLLDKSDEVTTSSKSESPSSVTNKNKASSPPAKRGPMSTEAAASFLNYNDCSDENSSSKNIFKDSDSESEISIGKDSIPSVSSVHTSDLSSYDDVISVNSEDGKKKKVSIHDIQKVWKTDRISAWCAENFDSPKKLVIDESDSVEEPKMVKNEEDSVSGSSSPTSSTFANESNSPQRVLPRRARKPNSKYMSDSILCPITQKQQKRMLESENSENEQIAAFPATSDSKNKKLKGDEENEKSSINSSHVESFFEKRIVKTSLQSSPDVFKPFASIRPLTSRKTAPLTLYSTAKQSPKK